MSKHGSIILYVHGQLRTATSTLTQLLNYGVGGQLRGDKECPFSGVTKSGRVWRKVPESDARSVQSWSQYADLWEGADRVGGQLR